MSNEWAKPVIMHFTFFRWKSLWYFKETILSRGQRMLLFIVERNMTTLYTLLKWFQLCRRLKKHFLLRAQMQMIDSKRHPTQRTNIYSYDRMNEQWKKTPECITAMWFLWQGLIKSAFPMECRCWRHISTHCSCVSLSFPQEYSIKQRKKGGLKDSWARPTCWERN